MDPHILVPDMFSNKKYSPLDIFHVCYDFSQNNKTYAHAHFYTVKVKYPSEVAKRKTYFWAEELEKKTSSELKEMFLLLTSLTIPKSMDPVAFSSCPQIFTLILLQVAAVSIIAC